MSPASGARPPSPPRSANGDHANTPLMQMRSYPPQGTYTPPQSFQPALPMDIPYEYADPSGYQLVAQPVHYYDPNPMFRSAPRHYTPTPEPYTPPMQTRSGRAIGSPPDDEDKTRKTAATRKRAPKKKPNKSAKSSHTINQPLSVLTKDYDVPVKDMHAWVNRPAEDRKKESQKKNGYVSRPMNSFMLYRSAYAERCKKFCSENNHQVVSQVTGASWPMEPEHIRKEYEQYAIIERDNHAATFPTYKFQPNKAGKKRGREDTDDDDSDGEWGSGRSKRSRTAASSRRAETPRSHASTPFDPEQVAYYSPAYQPAVAYNPSTYQYQYPNRQAPMYHEPSLIPRHYYQSNVVQYAPGIEDVSFRPVEMQFPTQDESLSLVGLPDNHFLASQNPVHAAAVADGDILDPRLGQLSPTSYQLAQLEALEYPIATPRTATFAAAFHPGHATLTDGGYGEADLAGADFERELQHFG